MQHTWTTNEQEIFERDLDVCIDTINEFSKYNPIIVGSAALYLNGYYLDRLPRDVDVYLNCNLKLIHELAIKRIIETTVLEKHLSINVEIVIRNKMTPINNITHINYNGRDVDVVDLNYMIEYKKLFADKYKNPAKHKRDLELLMIYKENN